MTVSLHWKNSRHVIVSIYPVDGCSAAEAIDVEFLTRYVPFATCGGPDERSGETVSGDARRLNSLGHSTSDAGRDCSWAWRSFLVGRMIVSGAVAMLTTAPSADRGGCRRTSTR